jgi:alcohol dehydrogenase class IV
MTEFSVLTDVVTGVGSLKQLQRLLDRHGATRVAVTVDAALVENGMLDMVLAHAPELVPVSLATFPPDPAVALVEEAIAQARSAGADSVLAIGGGSSLGAGKAMAIRLTNAERIWAYEGSGKVPVLPAPTIAIPTTAGSGSEVSNALVLHEPGRATDLVVRGRGCEPRGAILDGRLLRGLPERPMLYSGLDALTHAMEALWTEGASFFTESLAIPAATRIVELLPLALEGVASGRNLSGDNDEVLQELLDASCAANMACGNSGLGLVHALTSAPDVRLPHGLQNGVLLPYVGGFNESTISEAARKLLPEIEGLYARLAFVPSFAAVTSDVVLAESMIKATHGHPFRANNRRTPSDAQLESLLVAAGATPTELVSRCL